MKIIDNVAFQGDVLFMRVESIPDTARESTETGPIIVAHSETGHNHVLEGKAKHYLGDSMVSYLVLKELADIVHHRSYDTHETLRLTPGKWEVRRQREFAPEGWRRVED